MNIEFKDLKFVDTFHGRDYYITLVFPSGRTELFQISEIDYINFKTLEVSK